MFQKKIKIAIVLPVYNVSKYLRECLDSILKQTFDNFTIFAVDDGSTDNSGDILDEYALRDTRVIAFHRNNAGIAATRNFALDIIEKETIYEFISFVDSDDILDADFLMLHLSNIQKAKADMSVCGFVKLAENGEVRRQHDLLTERVFNGEEYINVIFSKNEWSNACGAGGMVWKQLYRAKAIHSLRFPEDRLILEDEPFNVMVAQRVNTIIYFPNTLYYYRQNNSSLCRDCNFQTRRLNGRKLCLENSKALPSAAQLVIFTAYIESILSLMKSGESHFNLRPFKEQVLSAYSSGALGKKTCWTFYLFCDHLICSKIYLCARALLRKVRSILGLRV